MHTSTPTPNRQWPGPDEGSLIQGHRGFSAAYPENTLLSFAAAVPHVDVIETDIRTTADGVLILFHDRVLTRTTNVRQVFPSRSEDPVESFTYAEIRRLDAGSWFAPHFARTPVPTLQEGLDLLAGTGIAVMLEIKQAALDDVGRVVRQTRQHQPGMRLALGAIDPEVARLAAEAVPELPAAVLAADQTALTDDRLADFASFAGIIGFRNARLRTDVLEAVLGSGVRALHGANTPEIMVEDIERGVNLRGTDDPALAAAVATGWSGRSLEAEDLVERATGPATVVRRARKELALPFKLSGEAAAVVTTDSDGAWAALPVDLAEPAAVATRVVTGPSGGCYDLVWDGAPVARVDTYSAAPARRRVDLATRADPGSHELRVRALGASPGSQGTELVVDVIDTTYLRSDEQP